MRMILSERNIVVVLFVMVFITFALAHEDSKKMERVYIGVNTSMASSLAELPETTTETISSLSE